MMNNQPVFSTFDLILVGAVATLFLILLLFLLLVYLRPWRFIKKKGKETFAGVEYPPVSVIVYAVNESENLKKNLPALLAQNYPEYQVVVVNDGSTDESADVLGWFETQYKNLYHTFIPQESRYLSRKKLALTVGIKAAKHNLLIFIDANCKPLSSQWIASIARNYRQKPDTKIVLGFSVYQETKGLFHKLVSYDNLLNGLRYLSAAIGGRPYMGSGRNLSYTKELFFESRGFSNSLNLHAGEDDLFINKHANGKNTTVEIGEKSFTVTEPFDRFSVWKEMKVSRAATQKYYKRGSLSLYRLEGFCYFLFILAILLSVVIGSMTNLFLIIPAAACYLFYYIAKMIVWSKSAKVFQQKSLLFWLPFFDLILPAINGYTHIYRAFRGKNDYTFQSLSKK